MSDGNEMVYMTEVPEDSVVVGLEIRQLPIPSDVLVVSILHDAVAIIPDGLSRLSAGDKLTVVATPTSMEAFKLMLAEKAPEAEAV